MNHNKCICIIPARGGSKRIKNKNIKKIFGKYLIQIVIETAKKSKIFDEIHVSTDSENIKKIAEKHGAKVSQLRNKKLSNDTAGTDAVLHDFVMSNNISAKYVACLYPTAILIKFSDLKKAYKKFIKDNSDCLLSIGKYLNNPLRSLELDSKNYIRFVSIKNIKKNSQELKDLFYDCGSFYFYKTEVLKSFKKIVFPKKTTGFLLHPHKSIDINYPEDLNMAKILYKSNLL